MLNTWVPMNNISLSIKIMWRQLQRGYISFHFFAFCAKALDWLLWNDSKPEVKNINLSNKTRKTVTQVFYLWQEGSVIILIS